MPTDPTTTTASGAGTPHLMVGLVFFGGGFTPIGSLALSLLELVPLHIGGPVLIGVAMVTAAIVIAFHPASRVLLVRGLLAGLVAVLVYDGTRLPFIILGSWPDFIPRIGDWLFDTDHVHWLVGYLWRYLGNGAGMGLAFMVVAPVAARRLGSVRFGLLYGVAIWSGLVATLLVAPDGQEKMFATHRRHRGAQYRRTPGLRRCARPHPPPVDAAFSPAGGWARRASSSHRSRSPFRRSAWSVNGRILPMISRSWKP